MKIRSYRWIIGPLALILAVVVAIFIFKPKTMPLPPPTETLSPKPPIVLFTPTSTPRQDTPSPRIFQYSLPEGWELIRESASAVSFRSKDGGSFIDVRVTNTGYPLEGESFERFVEAREHNYFIVYGNYEEISQDINQEMGAALVKKKVLKSGEPRIVFTYYKRLNQIIYVYDFWTSVTPASVNLDLSEEFFKEFRISNPDSATQEKYTWIYEFQNPNNIFTIKVPMAWRYEELVADHLVINSFISPDGHAQIQHIFYDDGDPITKSQAGLFTLELLRSLYEGEIRIIDDRVQPDGSERLSWESSDGSFKGASFFGSMGTTLSLLTIKYDQEYEQIYHDVLEYITASYKYYWK